MKHVTIYTDGACSGNPGPGGWAGIILHKGTEKHVIGGEEDTTNNRMELLAAIKSLEELKEVCKVDLYTDSSYVRNGIKDWIINWKKNNWRGSNKKEVKNKDLWQRLDSLKGKHEVSWHWVKAHNGDEYNEKADSLAVEMRDKYKK
jgi:ribonuclease HI